MSMKDAADTILQSQPRPDGSYDTLATVLRTDGDTVWVHIDGGAPETPCKKTVECKAGESVMVRISGGSAWITGNHTSPSTDDTEAEKAKEEARKAAGTATSFITDSDNGIFVHPKNSTQRGVRVTDVVDIIRDGKIVAEFGESVQIGETGDGKTVAYIENDGLELLHGSSVIAHLGYGLGTAQSGTAYAPYYTLGTRKDQLDWGIGNYSTVEGYDCVAHGRCSHAEGGATKAVGHLSHAEGFGTFAQGYASHAEGDTAVAKGNYAHAQNRGTTASSDYQTAIGYYNVEDTAGEYAFIIGNGYLGSRTAESNALTVDWNGNLECANVGAPTTISDFTVNQSGGNSTCTVREVKKSGNMMMVSLSFKCTQAYTANGSNLFVGTIPSDYVPAMSTTGTGYIGNVAVIGQINHAGQLTIRPCGALANAAEPYVYFHYFI